MALRTSVLLLTVPLLASACALPGRAPRPALAAPAAPPAPVARSAALVEAEAAIGRRDGAAAVSFAELAVRADPAAPVARAVLARAYVSAGRLQSAAQAHDDWLAAEPGRPQALLGLALTRIASGDNAGATAALDRAAGLPPSDLGLALALAGDTTRAVAVLRDAARTADATAQTRQNLALALALDGQWAQARAVAAQDLPADAVAARLSDWAALANRQGDRAPLLAMLGIAPAEADPGRPMALAWSMPGTAVAAAAPTDVAPPARPAPTTDPAIVPVPDGATAEIVSIAHSLPPAPDAAGGNWLVQVGAYAGPTATAAGWRALVARTPVLASREAVVSAKGPLIRLAAGGFASADEAQTFCRALQAGGTDCFIRRADPIALPAGRVQIAARR